MLYLAIYKIEQSNNFFEIKEFANENDRSLFQETIDYYTEAIGVTDTNDFLQAFKLPEQISDIDFDDDIYDRCDQLGIEYKHLM